MKWGTAVALLAGAGLVGCGPDFASPVRVSILAVAEDGSDYRIQPATLETLDSLTRLEGEAATVLGGAKIVIDYGRLADLESRGRLSTVEEVRDEVTKNDGQPPRAAFTPGELGGESDVLIADDFDSLAMVTAYHHLEKARLHALEVGMPADCLVGIPVFYDLKLIETDGMVRDPSTDNAAYFPLMDAFWVLPFDFYPTVPLAMNAGVMAHEYSHGVWGCLINDNAPLPEAELAMGEAGRNYLTGLNEGLADYLGASVTGEPDYIAKSIPEISVDRDLSVTRLYTQAMDDDAWNGDWYNPYALGAVLASALWAVRVESADPAAVDRVVLDSMVRLRELLERQRTSAGGFVPSMYFIELVDAFAAGAPADLPRSCAVLEARFSLLGEISNCP